MYSTLVYIICVLCHVLYMVYSVLVFKMRHVLCWKWRVLSWASRVHCTLADTLSILSMCGVQRGVREVHVKYTRVQVRIHRVQNNTKRSQKNTKKNSPSV